MDKTNAGEGVVKRTLPLAVVKVHDMVLRAIS